MAGRVHLMLDGAAATGATKDKEIAEALPVKVKWGTRLPDWGMVVLSTLGERHGGRLIHA
jgi:hypothetical protein